MRGHTPTPWALGKHESIESESGWVGYLENGAADNTEANAAFIVRAVNAHENLVAALREARTFVEAQAEAFEKANHMAQLNTLDMIDSALAKAAQS